MNAHAKPTSANSSKALVEAFENEVREHLSSVETDGKHNAVTKGLYEEITGCAERFLAQIKELDLPVNSIDAIQGAAERIFELSRIVQLLPKGEYNLPAIESIIYDQLKTLVHIRW